MNKLVIYAIAAFVVIAAAGGWYAKQQYDAEQRGRALERAKVAAQSNQNIAERRKTDASFDKMDAAALCRDAGLDWKMADGRSYCE